MLRVGITGGIGSGKSTVAGIFRQLGVPVYYADEETKKLYSENASLRLKMQQLFGENIYDGAQLNRAALAQIVFNDPAKLASLNALVHPYVFEHYESWCAAHSAHPYTLKEAAIIFESGSYKHLHLVIGVMADEALRIERVKKRDHADEKSIRQRIAKQLPQDELLKRCDFTIDNNGTYSLVEQVNALHKLLMERGTQPVPPLKTH